MWKWQRKELKTGFGKKRAYLQTDRGPGRPPDFDKRIEAAENYLEEARKDLESAEFNQQRMKEAIQKIGKVYHPVDIETVKLQQADAVSQSLNECFAQIESVASEASLSSRSVKRILKAKKLVVDMVAVILFYHMHIQAKIEALSLPPKVEWTVLNKLIPGLYIQRVSKQAKGAEERLRLRTLSENILGSLKLKDGPFGCLSEEELNLVEKVGAECARLIPSFQLMCGRQKRSAGFAPSWIASAKR